MKKATDYLMIPPPLRDDEIRRMIQELRLLRSKLNNHDNLIRCREAIYQFFNKKDQEIVIKLIANTCASKIEITINGEKHDSDELKEFDIHKLISKAIQKYSK